MSEQYPPFNPDLYSTPLQQNPYYQHLSQEQLPRMRQAPIPTDGMINQEFPVTKREAPARLPLSQTKEVSEDDEYVEKDPSFTYNGFQVVRGCLPLIALREGADFIELDAVAPVFFDR